MTAAQERGLVLAGASTVGRGTPWGTLCEVVAKALSAHGYTSSIEARSWGPNNGRWVADGRADLGAWHLSHLIDCYRGTGNYEREGRRDNLRVIANINHPSWLGLAVRREAGIDDLAGAAGAGRPLRVRRGVGRVCDLVCEHYGWTEQALGAAGGFVAATHELHDDPATAPVVEPEIVPWVKEGDFDVIVDSIYTGYPPEIPHWSQASVLWDLDFVPLPAPLVARLCDSGLVTPGVIPHRLLRGLWHDVASVARLPHVIYTRAECPTELVRTAAAALDEHRKSFRECHLAYSYDPADVAEDHGVPFHEGAAAYYDEVGYPR